MRSFASYLAEGSAVKPMRVGIKHPKDLRHAEVAALIHGGKLQGTMTEKSDGMAFEVGHDDQGFYTRSARSDKVRNSGDYTAYTKQKYGADHVSPFAHHYDDIHHQLSSNPHLTQYLARQHAAGKPSTLRGEMFWKPLGEKTKKGVKFVGTSYDPHQMGKNGKFIMHSEMPENQEHDAKNIGKLSDANINFDHDLVKHGKVAINVSDEKRRFDSIDPEKLTSRKAADREAREHEQRKLEDVKSRIEGRLKEHAAKNPNRWGAETEGHVFHPASAAAQRIKITSDTFKQFKKDQANAKV